MTIPDCFYRFSIKGLIYNETRTKFLICKEENGWWDLPGGGLEWGEEPVTALTREIKEEMGLVVTSVAPTPTHVMTGAAQLHNDMQIAHVVYECTLEHFEFTLSQECVEIRFVNMADIAALQTIREVGKLAKFLDL